MILFGSAAIDAEVRAFVGARLKEDFGSVAPGIGVWRSGRLVGGVVYTNYRHPYIELSAAGELGWLSPAGLRVIFGYPFKQLGCAGVIALCRRGNKEGRRLVEGLGWKRPYAIPEAFGDEDGILYTMRRSECRWLRGK